jgi:hypothetical protein
LLQFLGKFFVSCRASQGNDDIEDVVPTFPALETPPHVNNLHTEENTGKSPVILGF